jgi:hypothetical protein
MQLFIFLALRWTHLILINVNLVQQDATIQDKKNKRKPEILLFDVSLIAE